MIFATITKILRKSLWSIACLAVVVTAAPAVASTLLPTGHIWEYTFTNPTGDPTWNTTTGVGGIWSSGSAPFGNVSGGDFGYGTYWPASGSWGDDLWVRTTIDLTGVDLSTVLWDLGVDNGFTLYANAALVSAFNAEGYTFRWEYSGGFGSALTSGINVIALALEDHGGLTAFDMQITGTHVTSVPEPSTVILLGTGLASLIGLKLRRWRRIAA